MSYYIGLSILSNKKAASAEARRILSVFNPGAEIREDANGRPYFPCCDADFNISHCKRPREYSTGALTAVSFTRGARTGCDIEQVRYRENAGEIAKTYFSASEINYISGSDEKASFFKIWTLKECYIKLRGMSVFDMASVPSFIKDDGSFGFCSSENLHLPLFFSLYDLSYGNEQYILCAVAEGGNFKPPEVRWFSQSPFICKNIIEIKA
ncbi:MAG: 4'-phosphopantetheinyl transferase superfamily protein [Treponema sp.]|nr:4'-phosphopantetheinyl transferase superfamily protein [Treponema sp.]